MIRRIFFCGTIIAISFLIIGCASPTSAPPPAQPTTASAAPVVPVARSNPAPLPAQPTSPPLAPRAALGYASPTPAVSVKGPEVTRPSSSSSSASSASSTASTASTAPTVAPPTATRAATATQAASSASSASSSVVAASGVATGKRSEVKFAFLTPLTPQEEADPLEFESMQPELKKVRGFLDMSGDENVIIVGYDAGLVTVDQLIATFAQLKHPVKRQ